MIRQNLSYPFLIVVVWLVVSWRWLSGFDFIPWDSIEFFFPQVAFIVAALRRGEMPTWNPLSLGGMPVLGDPQSMLFTPHVITGLISGPYFGLWVFDVTTLLCVLLGSLCLYRYVRSHGGASLLAALSSIVFLLGGYATSRLQHVPQVISYALLPVLLVAFRSAAQRPTIGPLLGLSAVGALLLLNPNHVVFLVPFLLGPMLLQELLSAPHPAVVLSRLAAVIFLVAIVALPSLSAILETVTYSNRSMIDLHTNDPASLPSSVALSIILPGMFGVRSEGLIYWGPVDMTESYLYIGIIPFFIIVLGMIKRPSPSAILIVVWIMVVISFLYAMGTSGPLLPWLVENIPGFSLFRRPSDGAYFLILYCSLAVGLAFSSSSDRLRYWPERLLVPAIGLVLLSVCIVSLVTYAAQHNYTYALMGDFLAWFLRFVICGVVLAALWILLPQPQKVLGLSIGAITLTAIDLASAGRLDRFTGHYRSDGVAPMYRVLSHWRDAETPDAISMRDLENAWSHGGGRVEVVGGSSVITPMVLGIPMSQGYNPLRLQRYVDVFGGQHLRSDPKRFTKLAPSPDSAAYRWLGLRFVLIHKYILENAEKFGELGRAALALRDTAVAGGAKNIPSKGIYLLLELPNPYPRAGLIAEGQNSADQQCDVIHETTTQLRYLCESSIAAKLVLGDSFAPGWSACVNGYSVPIEPFMTALRSIPIPPGKSDVELNYQPVPFLRRTPKCGRGT